MSALDAAYFDQWYADMATSPARDAILSRTLDVPSSYGLPGVLTGPALDELSAALGLPADGLLLDIACGRGGYGIELARRAGSRLIGVDFSAVALSSAVPLAASRLPGRASFQVGTLDATGLDSGIADGLMCIDAVQFAAPPLAGLAEFRRLLKPGGRLVVTCWEGSSADVPARIQAVDLARDLPLAGFVDVLVEDRPGWRAAERSLWEEALAAPPSDPAIVALQDEARSSLATFDVMHRVFATATAP
ncbi:class I SAM-dependent methyltransferase [Dactylosporangium sp. CS-033363]|uniref:class I SAM-dependent methyltransferase n=1 Tax=Dactylosporangium sp. CS-033363 TaxID=3239935 RepID=UPI003D8FCAF2